MKQVRLLISDAAVSDILEQADWYRAQSGETLAARWEKAVTATIIRITKNPPAGTRCAFRSVDLHDVRRATIRGFPRHLLFYRFNVQEAVVLRVVHGARDLERLL